MMLCEYGCGLEAKYQFKNGKWCCSNSFHRCQSQKEKISLKLLENWKDPNSGYNSIERSLKLSFSTKKNMIKGNLIRENLNKKVKEKWNDKTSNYNKKEYREKLKTKGKLRFSTPINENKICEYGCGEKANYFFPKSNKYCCSKSWQSCSNKRKESKDLAKLFIEQIKSKYPTFFKEEEMRYNPDKIEEKEIQVRCKNSKCKNSKENGGWFTPERESFFNRIYAIERNDGNDASYLYCCNDCKQECPLYGKKIEVLIKQDQIRAGIVENPWYTSSEYQTWKQNIFDLDNELCIYCGKPAEHAHHILPQKTYPNLALDPDNGIACCSECHYKYGHRDKECTTGHLSKLVCERIVRIKNKIEE